MELQTEKHGLNFAKSLKRGFVISLSGRTLHFGDGFQFGSVVSGLHLGNCNYGGFEREGHFVFLSLNKFDIVCFDCADDRFQSAATTGVNQQ